MTCRHLVVLLGDQLSLSVSSLAGFDKNQDHILMMEVMEELSYVPQHPLKVVFFLSAMRHFAKLLCEKSYPLLYYELAAKNKYPHFDDAVLSAIKKLQPQKIIITEPGEYRILQKIKHWQAAYGVDIEIRGDDRFLCSIDEFKAWAKDRKELRMEYFYRYMRKKTGILMKGDKPLGGKWNYDADNRSAVSETCQLPKIPNIKHDAITLDVIAVVRSLLPSSHVDLDTFSFAVTHKDANKLLTFFCEQGLEYFGTYQDAMLQGENSLFHSQLSLYMNCGLLSPQYVIEQVLKIGGKNKVSVNNIEGYVRQILGWREYMRGMYWLHMPKYKSLNFLKHKNKLPDLYWTAETDMACLSHCVGQTLRTATSHHIQRLMVTGNFALLCQVAPEAVCEWYLAVYADAIEWVELPNTLGMSQFADGGLIASKPYISSGNYIHKMSNFCDHCSYNVKHKLEEDACPFNFLYWNFLIQHKEALQHNPRIKFAYNHINKMTPEHMRAIKKKAKDFLATI